MQKNPVTITYNNSSIKSFYGYRVTVCTPSHKEARTVEFPDLGAVTVDIVVPGEQILVVTLFSIASALENAKQRTLRDMLKSRGIRISDDAEITVAHTGVDKRELTEAMLLSLVGLDAVITEFEA